MFCFNFQFFPYHEQFKNQQPNQKFKMQIVKYKNSLPLDLFKINFYFNLGYLFNPQQWCQKWDIHVQYSGDSFIIFIK